MGDKRESLKLVMGTTKSLRHRLELKGEVILSQAVCWRWATFPILLFLCTRIALLGFSHIAMTLTPDLWDARGSREFLQQFPALDGLCRWDCEFFYKEIARVGYWKARATIFFPLYPMLARAMHEVTGIHLHLALLIVANTASLGALLVIYRLFAILSGEDAARWGLALFVAYPFAFFQAAGYPESLMIFFSALAILLALRGNHIWAGVALGFGVLARHLTLLAGTGLLAAQLRQRGIHPKRFLLSPAILGLVVPWLFLGLYCLYLDIKFDNPLAFWAARDEWGGLAWWGIMDLLTTKECSGCVPHLQVMRAYLVFALIPSVGVIALVTKQQWIELALFAIALMVIVLLTGMWALGRYSASFWPAFLPLGVWLSKQPNLQGPVIVMLALFQGLFFYLFALQFPIL
jgi:hypothetical protein